MKKTLTLYIKYIWLAAVIVFVSMFIYSRFPLILETIVTIPGSNIIISVLILFLAKFFLVMLMYYSLLILSKQLSFKECYNIYNTSQISKYIPGSIWHFLSRGFAYQRRGFSFSEIKNALLVENLFLVGSAFLLGIGILVFKKYTFLHQLLLSHYIWFLCAGAAFVLCAIFFYTSNNISISELLRKIKLNGFIKMILVLLCIWMSLGYSFYILAEPCFKESITVIEVAGVFTLAFVLGYVTPFAPAGIGVREAVLVSGLSSLLDYETAIIITVFSRVIYLIVEILLALSTLIIRDRTFQVSKDDSKEIL